MKKIIPLLLLALALNGCKTYRISDKHSLKENFTRKYERKMKGDTACKVTSIANDSLGNGLYWVVLGSSLDSRHTLHAIVRNGRALELREESILFTRRQRYRFCRRKLERYLNEEQMKKVQTRLTVRATW